MEDLRTYWGHPVPGDLVWVEEAHFFRGVEDTVSAWQLSGVETICTTLQWFTPENEAPVLQRLRELLISPTIVAKVG
jgi:hypothetical protein